MNMTSISSLFDYKDPPACAGARYPVTGQSGMLINVMRWQSLRSTLLNLVFAT
jgi:hypothetical protein